ncbi:Uncharacterized sugar transferase EpsL [Sphingomonas sp. EC-HK361]|uniref:sugar transferase n=1 Tax=Sphingomonas sp. EC-HK361 TaxID=2038397 RepID=UPI001259C455|nr:sugar transferase [Sphingomonas sp. EC-HK361]VVT22530.1 Uncharacterized sugar transferase EpsL [Sphingomonas sp. EC-HK361]
MAAIRPAALISIVALILLAPALLALALLVRIGMGRPVLFHQHRAGRGGAPFRMMKFRTMRDANDASGRPLPDEQRITGLGRFLRRSRLDELPELVNIVAGDMDIVGPRPLLPATIEAMGAGGIVRGRVRPGLTGLAQVSGNTLLSNDEKLAFDIWYVRNRSWRLDCAILLRTVLVVLFGERRTRWHADDARHSRGGC